MGRLIPAGTGFAYYRMLEAEKKKLLESREVELTV
jgi:hypothetical protein